MKRVYGVARFEHYVIEPGEMVVMTEPGPFWGKAACGQRLNLRAIPPEGVPRCPECLALVEWSRVMNRLALTVCILMLAVTGALILWLGTAPSSQSHGVNCSPYATVYAANC